MESHRRSLAAGAAGAIATAGLASANAAAPPAPTRAVLDQMTPGNSAVLLADFQPQFIFSTRSAPIDTIVNNVVALAKSARLFGVPTIVSTITAQAFAGPLLADLQAVDPGNPPIDRTVINAWSEPRVREAIKAAGRKKLLIAGLWTDNCVMLPALSALSEGYEVYIVADASGDYDGHAHHFAIQRLVQAGAVPVTWLAVLLEWQADWARTETAGGVNAILREHAKAVGIGAQYLAAIKR